MAWRVARSLDVLLDQINKIAPDRDKASDGSIGDTDHRNRRSDHNPHCGPGVVTARDFDHDPAKGADMNEIAEALRKSRDPRIKYVIWDKRMFSSYATSTHAAWTWRPYSGPNLHTIHMHVSVNCDGNKDSDKPWDIGGGKDWFEMATKKELREVVRAEVQRAVQQLAVGKEENWNKKYMNIKDVEQRIIDKIKGGQDA